MEQIKNEGADHGSRLDLERLSAAALLEAPVEVSELIRSGELRLGGPARSASEVRKRRSKESEDEDEERRRAAAEATLRATKKHGEGRKRAPRRQ